MQACLSIRRKPLRMQELAASGRPNCGFLTDEEASHKLGFIVLASSSKGGSPGPTTAFMTSSKPPTTYSLHELDKHLNAAGMPCEVCGIGEKRIVAVNTLDDAGPDDLSFLSNAKYVEGLKTTKAGAVIVAKDQEVPGGMTVLRAADAYAAMAMLVLHIHGWRKHPAPSTSFPAVIHPTALIGPGANIHHGVTIAENVVVGRNAVMYPGVYVADGCRIGDDCVLYPNVVLYDGSVLGNRVTIHAGTIIGEDGLGYAPVKGKWQKIPQVGTVEIADDVEVGSNCSIDRATLGKTLIGSGTKFSNLIAIGHGTKIGADCMFVAQVGIAGSVDVGNHVTMAGKVGVAGHLTIGDNAQIAAMAGVMRDVPPNMRMMGAPAVEMTEAARSMSLVMKLPEMRKQLRKLEQQVEKLLGERGT